MSLATTDQLLAEWEERLQRVDASLLALEADPTYQMLAPRAAPRAALEGETARVVGPALAAFADLFEQRGRLTELLDRARAVRASMSSFWGNEEKEREVRELLEGASIELPPETTPLARRALLDPGARDVRVSPGQLLAAMADAYDRARDATVAVQRAWEGVEPALVSTERQLEDARTSADALGVRAAVDDELGAIERDLEAARTRVARDPLGTSGEVFARLVPRVSAVTAQLGALAALRGRVEDGLGRARATLEEVRSARGAATRAVERLPLEVEGARAPRAPTDETLVAGLAPWLDKLDAVARAGRWSAADVGLQRWFDAAHGYLVADREIHGTLEALLARREELQGRISARRAQARTQGMAAGSAEDALADEASRLLGIRPTPLARASEVVERYEQALRRVRR